jgi:hypothetical protein
MTSTKITAGAADSDLLKGKHFRDTPENRGRISNWLASNQLTHAPENVAAAVIALEKNGNSVLELTAAERARRQAQAEREYAERLKNDPILREKREAEARQAAEAAERKHWAERSKPLPGENSLATLQRVHREKEMAARRKVGMPLDPYSYGGKQF